MASMIYRAATPADLDIIHRELMAVIDESPHYNAVFKAHEKGRLTRQYLKALQAQDPFHVICVLLDGVPAGGLISGPEYGAIFRYWSWIFPAYRRSRLGFYGMRLFDEHWDNGRFHKAYTFVRPENTVALALLDRYGYTVTATLKTHIFGQDYCLVEKSYTKTTDGYDTGMGIGRIGKILQKVGAVVGR